MFMMKSPHAADPPAVIHGTSQLEAFLVKEEVTLFQLLLLMVRFGTFCCGEGHHLWIRTQC